MCGIAGIVNLDDTHVHSSTLQLMAKSIAHRGPDGEGVYIDSNLGFAHRRLAIIDITEAGHQPMVSKDKKIVLSYNGEIYNFIEIRDELLEKGYQFYSDSDTEVLLNAWHEWGQACILKLNGMFAFSVHDKRDNSVYLVRDRYGIKPLYLSQIGQTLIFGSEQKAIEQHPNSYFELDKEALYEYMTFQNILTNKTINKSIKLLPPASVTKIDLTKKNLMTRTYWDFDFSEPTHKADVKEYREELTRLLNLAVNRQLRSDVELGSYLSGGMDSGTLSSIASQKFPNVKTFTCGFDLSSASGMELGFDERVLAEALSARYKTEHYEIVLKAGDMERCLSELVYHLEEPRVGQSYPNFYASKLASKFVKVVLSGAGGDELFGGYPWRYYKASNSKNFEDFINSYYIFWQRLVDNKQLRKIFNPIFSDVEHVWTKDIFSEVFLSHKNELNTPEDYVNHSLYFEAKTFLQGLLIVEDKISMSHGLETRVPFLDNDLVDFAMNCPVNLKLNNLHENLRLDENSLNEKNTIPVKTNDGKQILRDVMRQYVPEEITSGIKKGFSSPDASWFKGESMSFIEKKLLTKKSIIYEFLDFKECNSIINDHMSGKVNKRLFIWSLLHLDELLSQKSL